MLEMLDGIEFLKSWVGDILKKLQDGYRIEQEPLQLCGGFLGSKGTQADKDMVKLLVNL